MARSLLWGGSLWKCHWSAKSIRVGGYLSLSLSSKAIRGNTAMIGAYYDDDHSGTQVPPTSLAVTSEEPTDGVKWSSSSQLMERKVIPLNQQTT